MLKSLTLHQFRFIKPGTKLMFTEHFNVLLGRNGTGKTTLLDLISMVLRSDFSALREEEFDIEYEFTHENDTGLVRFANKRMPRDPSNRRENIALQLGKSRPLHPRVEVSVHLDTVKKNSDVEVVVEGSALRSRNSGGTWENLGNLDVFGSLALEALGDVILSSDRSAHAASAFLHEFNRCGQWAYRFDESLGVFESITAGDTGRMPKVGQAPAISLDMWFYPETAETPHPIVRQPVFISYLYEPTRPNLGESSTTVKLAHGSTLAKFPDLTGLAKMTMSLALEKSWQDEDGEDTWRFGHAEFLFSGLRGANFSHNFLSYGQKRLLAFLYYLDANNHFVIADELVNGMHHDWIRACLDEIGDRQSFLTSQNPLMLDYLPLESAEQVQKSFIQCRSEIVDDTTQIVWSNLATEDAEELFADYQVGIQHVGEILRVRGLW